MQFSDTGRLNGLALAALLLPTLSSAAEPASVSFDIPAQVLSGALTRFSAATGLQVLYDGDLTQNINAPALKGDYSAEQALRKLLQGSGLNYRFSNGNTVTLEKAAVVAPQSANTATMPAVTVTGKNVYDATDPYNPDYARPNASTATKTDTPIMETPMSIKVVPRAVMDDQQIVLFDDAVIRNVSGVQRNFDFGDLYQGFIVRGFSLGANIYRDGLRQNTGYFEPAGMERVEVLKGAAAMLYGRTQPGGLVNYVTKKPLDKAHYSLQQQFGSYDLYRTTADATGPINDDKSLLYRLNIAYSSNNSFRDFNENERIYVAPSLTWRLSDQTDMTVQFEHQHDDYVMDFGIPAVGDRPAQVPKSFFVGDAAVKKLS